MTDIRFKYLDIPTISDADWRDLLALFTKQSAETDPHDPIRSDEAMRKSILMSVDQPNFIKRWLVYDAADTCVAYFVAVHPKPENPDYEANKHTMHIGIYIDKPYRQQGIGAQIVPMLAKQADEFGATTIQGGSTLESGHQFAKKLGTEIAFQERISRMVMADVDWEMMQQWVADGKTRNPDVEIIRFDSVPSDDDIEAYCQLITDIVRTIPRENLEHFEFTQTVEELRKEYTQRDKLNQTEVVLVARDSDGAMMGMTTIFYDPERATIAYVGLTGVLEKYQGRGLGKYLKALMTYAIRETFPQAQYVNTENAESNASMLSINERMDFKLYKHWIAYKIKVTELMEKV